MTHELSPSGMPNPEVRLPRAGQDLRRAALKPLDPVEPLAVEGA